MISENPCAIAGLIVYLAKQENVQDRGYQFSFRISEISKKADLPT